MVSCKRSIRLLAFLILAAVGLSIVSGCGDDDSVVKAAPEEETDVTMQLVAVIATVSDSDNLLGGNIEVGDNILGTYTYDLTTVDDNTIVTVGDYRHDSSPYGIFLSINGIEFRTDLNNVDFLLELVNDHGVTPRDNYLLRSYNNAVVSINLSVDHISWQLDDPDAEALTSTDLTSEPPVLADWTSTFGLTITGFQTNDSAKTFMIRGHVSSVTKVE